MPDVLAKKTDALQQRGTAYSDSASSSVVSGVTLSSDLSAKPARRRSILGSLFRKTTRENKNVNFLNTSSGHLPDSFFESSVTEDHKEQPPHPASYTQEPFSPSNAPLHYAHYKDVYVPPIAMDSDAAHRPPDASRNTQPYNSGETNEAIRFNDQHKQSGIARNEQWLPPWELGLDDVTGIFAFDRLLDLFCFATVAGNLKLVTSSFEFILKNPLEDQITLWHIQLIPGVGRIVTFGVSSTLGEHQRRFLQCWDVSQHFPASPKTLNTCVPITLELPFLVFCIHRVRVNQNENPNQLYQHCVAKVHTESGVISEKKNDKKQRHRSGGEERFSPKGAKNPALFESSSVRSPSPSVYSSRSRSASPAAPASSIAHTSPQPSFISHKSAGNAIVTSATSVSGKATAKSSNRSCSATGALTSEQRQAVVHLFCRHPDNSPFPFGDPTIDSRWLFFVGTSEGDVRVFDAFTSKFVDYVIASEAGEGQCV